MDDLVCLQIELTVVDRIKSALRDGKENATELLANHDASLGRTTKKNDIVARLYQSQIEKCEELIKLLS